MKSSWAINWLERHRRMVLWTSGPILLLLIVSVWYLVHATGGVKYAYYHAMYIPILLAGLVFGTRGGVAAGLLAGLVLGPFVPIDVNTGEMQETANWLYRLGFFCLIGGLAGSSRDAVKWYVGKLRRSVYYDTGTGLPNRTALIDRLRESRPVAPPAESDGALIMVSIENADELGTSFGSGSIDRLALQLAQRLKEIVDDEKTVYRVDTSKLGMYLEHVSAIALTDLTRDLERGLVRPLPLGAVTVHADSCIGVVKLEESKLAAEDLVDYAELSLALARESSGKIVISAASIVSRNRESVELMGQLWQALENDQIELHYQPKIALDGGNVVAVEALMRWRHPEHGMVPPMKFIPRAEKSTLIDDLTRFVVGKALDQLVLWHGRGIEIGMAVNVSAQNLMDPEFGQMVREQLARRDLDGSWLELEVTESALIRNIEKISEMLHGLSGLKVVISIDDFGTGYSSLQYMKDLPVTIIKIDQVFVKPLADDPGAAHIVSSTIDLGHRLRMQVVAEGVENAAILETLGRMDCDMAQGYHIARPMAAASFEKWYRANKGRFADSEGTK